MTVNCIKAIAPQQKKTIMIHEVNAIYIFSNYKHGNGITFPHKPTLFRSHSTPYVSRMSL